MCCAGGCAGGCFPYWQPQARPNPKASPTSGPSMLALIAILVPPSALIARFISAPSTTSSGRLGRMGPGSGFFAQAVKSNLHLRLGAMARYTLAAATVNFMPCGPTERRSGTSKLEPGSIPLPPWLGTARFISEGGTRAFMPSTLMDQRNGNSRPEERLSPRQP